MDSLLLRSNRATDKASRLQGIFIQTEKTDLIPPDILFKTVPENRDRGAIPYENVDAKIRALENTVAEMSLNIEKLTFISRNLISQSESHSKNSNLLTKLIETLIAALGAIVVGYFTTVVFKKKK
jgi:hypothetical protein